MLLGKILLLPILRWKPGAMMRLDEVFGLSALAYCEFWLNLMKSENSSQPWACLSYVSPLHGSAYRIRIRIRIRLTFCGPLACGCSGSIFDPTKNSRLVLSELPRRFFFICWGFGSVCVSRCVSGNQAHIRHFHTCLLVFIVVVCSSAISYAPCTVLLFII